MRLVPTLHVAAACLLTVAAPMCAAADTPVRPNFLFIAIDDLKPITGYLAEEPGSFLQSIYPDKEKRAAIRRILSPNLDRLAASGVAFSQAACASALCNPSRTALLTGIRTHVSGISGNSEHFRQIDYPFVQEAVTLPQNLRAQGYYTAGTGKIFHTSSVQLDKANGEITKDWPDTAHSWDVWINDHATPSDGRNIRHKYSADGLFSFGSKDTTTERMNDYQKADLIASALEKGKLTVEDTRHGGEKTIDLTTGKPFFLACGIFKPHLPWFAPEEILALFDADDIAIDRAFFEAMVDDLRDLPQGALRQTEKRNGADKPGRGRFQDLLDQGTKLDGGDGDLAAWREAVRHFLACIVVADRAVGRLLDALEHSAYRDNTVVVLWSDHGWNLGTKYRMGKVALWDESANCVLLVRDPRTPQTAGSVSHAPVNLIDLYRTIAALAGVAVPDYVSGHSFAKLLVEPAAQWRIPSLTSQNERNHSVTDGRFRYMRFGNNPGDVEFYDHRSDPWERTNVAGTPKYAKAQVVFDDALNQLLAVDKVPPPPASRVKARAAGDTDGD